MSRRGTSYSTGVRNVVVTSRPRASGAMSQTIPYARTQALVKVNPKMMSGSQTKPKRKPKQTQGQNSEFVAKKLSYGRKPKNNFANLSRFVRGNISRTVFGIHQVTRFGGTTGAIKLTQTQTTPGAVCYAPLHLYDLTSCVNAEGGSITVPNTSWFLSFANETTTAIATLNNRSVNFAVEAAPNATSIVQNYPGPSSIMRWVQARMIFYAPTTVPSKIKVQIVQFTEEDLCPKNEVVGATVLNARASAWYQAYMKSAMLSPIETTQALGFKGIKVLHSETFIMNPKESTEATSTHYKQLDIFKWMNRKCNYIWNQSAGTGVQTPLPAQNAGNNETTVHPRARVFLLISGQAGLSSSDTITLHPSYDIVLRTQHEQLSA